MSCLKTGNSVQLFGEGILKSGCKLVVRSVNQEGHRFRPSDWIERISTTLATFGPDNRLHYSDSVQPCVVNGEKCLVVDQSLAQENPTAYEYIMAFVRANRLQTVEDCDPKVGEQCDAMPSGANIG